MGQSTPIVNALFEGGQGRVIFVDEISGFFSSGYREEISKSLISFLENFPEKFVFVAADYSDKYDQMTKLDAGLAGRIPFVFDIPKWDANTSLHVLERQLIASKKIVSPLLHVHLHKRMTEIANIYDKTSERGFASGRTVRSIYESIMTECTSSTKPSSLRNPVTIEIIDRVFDQVGPKLRALLPTPVSLFPEINMGMQFAQNMAQEILKPKEAIVPNNPCNFNLKKLMETLGGNLLKVSPSYRTEYQKELDRLQTVHCKITLLERQSANLLKSAHSAMVEKNGLQTKMLSTMDVVLKERLRLEIEMKRKAEEVARLASQREADEAARILEKERKKEDIRARIVKISRCPVNLVYIYNGAGSFTCTGGGHTVTLAQLGLSLNDIEEAGIVNRH